MDVGSKFETLSDARTFAVYLLAFGFINPKRCRNYSPCEMARPTAPSLFVAMSQSESRTPNKVYVKFNESLHVIDNKLGPCKKSYLD